MLKIDKEERLDLIEELADYYTDALLFELKKYPNTLIARNINIDSIIAKRDELLDILRVEFSKHIDCIEHDDIEDLWDDIDDVFSIMSYARKTYSSVDDMVADRNSIPLPDISITCKCSKDVFTLADFLGGYNL